jgi:hypothetical protein
VILVDPAIVAVRLAVLAVVGLRVVTARLPGVSVLAVALAGRCAGRCLRRCDGDAGRDETHHAERDRECE